MTQEGLQTLNRICDLFSPGTRVLVNDDEKLLREEEKEIINSK